METSGDFDAVLMKRFGVRLEQMLLSYVKGLVAESNISAFHTSTTQSRDTD
jgi:hypothetical protein